MAVSEGVSAALWRSLERGGINRTRVRVSSSYNTNPQPAPDSLNAHIGSDGRAAGGAASSGGGGGSCFITITSIASGRKVHQRLSAVGLDV